jgi:hypothetical protein
MGSDKRICELIEELMFEFNPPIALVMNGDSEKPSLEKQAVFVVPYGMPDGTRRISVMQGGIADIAKINARGIYAHGMGTFLKPVKDIGVTSDLDIRNQVEGYLSVLRMTDGNPVSVVLFGNTEGFSLSGLTKAALHTYRSQFISEKFPRFPPADDAVERHRREAYSIFSPQGMKRRLTGATGTIYTANDNEILEGVAASMHPNQKVTYFPPSKTSP